MTNEALAEKLSIGCEVAMHEGTTLRERMSEKEAKMFEILGFGYLLDKEIDIEALSLYRMATEQCFLENTQGPAVESLRKSYKAYLTCKVYRMTPEFDALIELT